ncbi:hypothetical protein AMATHDRAFT_3054 [Amanita thiersii Skay4041]|uniref:DUF6534 domain-containing protein n=1 Tax=Amanita thiersii Skay4041 TaxID=703135 RepID=A0A2A9NUS7_9AGAR|nr:hypothetical protein AMATHDRAFT_3054 [Amanita thiersii Skay4041]
MNRAFDKSAVNALLLDGFFQSFLLGTIFSQGTKYWNDYRDDSRLKRIFVAISIFLIPCIVMPRRVQTVLEDYKSLKRCPSPSVYPSHPMGGFTFEWLHLLHVPIFLCSKMLEDGWRKALGAVPACFSTPSYRSDKHLSGIAFNGSNPSNDILNVSRNLLPSTITVFTIWMFGTLTLDVLVTAIRKEFLYFDIQAVNQSLTVVVLLWRSKTGLLQSDKIIKRIIVITWESAALPSTCTILAAALYHVELYTYDHLVILFVLQTGKLYALGMLWSLNMRTKLRHKLRSQDLGGRRSLHDWQWDGSYTVCTSTVRNSEPYVLEPPKHCEPPTQVNIELFHVGSDHPLNSGTVDTQWGPENLQESQAFSESHSDMYRAPRDEGMARHRFNSWRSLTV